MILALLSDLVLRAARAVIALTLLLALMDVVQAAPHPAVARIIVAEKNAQSLGSGTLVDVRDNCGLVITNWHVVRDAAGNILVSFPDGFTSPARILKTDKDWDLAALVIWKPNAQPVSISALPPQIGEPLMIAGYGSGDYRAATGRCTQYVSPGKKFPFEMVELSTEARQGDSGGPIFNQSGEMAGVLFGASKGSTSGSYGGRVRWFLGSLVPDFDQRNPSHSQPAIASAPVGIWQGTQSLASQTSQPAITNNSPAKLSSLGTPQSAAVDLASEARPQSAASNVTAAPVSVARSVEPQSDLLTPGLGGYGFSSLPDRQTVGSSLTRSIFGTNSNRNSTNATGSGEIDWRALIGNTPLDQGKSSLALIGALLLLLKMFRPSEK